MGINSINNSGYNPIEVLRQATTQPLKKQNPLDIPKRESIKESLTVLNEKTTKPVERDKFSLANLVDVNNKRIQEAMSKDGPSKNPVQNTNNIQKNPVMQENPTNNTNNKNPVMQRKSIDTYA